MGDESRAESQQASGRAVEERISKQRLQELIDLYSPPVGDGRSVDDICYALRELLAVREQKPVAIDRSAWHDKAWALYHERTFSDTMLAKVNIHTIRAVLDATYDALYAAPKERPAAQDNGRSPLAHQHGGESITDSRTFDSTRAIIEAFGKDPEGSDDAA